VTHRFAVVSTDDPTHTLSPDSTDEDSATRASPLESNNFRLTTFHLPSTDLNTMIVIKCNNHQDQAWLAIFVCYFLGAKIVIKK
jgi:hypothetical protein